MEFAVSAPGKVIIHGEHSVVFGKTALAVSLGLRTITRFKETGASVINLELPSIKIKETLPLQLVNEEILNYESFIDDPEKLPHEEHLEKTASFVNNAFSALDHLDIKQRNALVAFFYVVFGVFGGRKMNGFDITCTSDLTIGAGTGSSASYAVCLAGVLLKFAKGLHGNEASAEMKWLICKWAYNCERIMHGTPSGLDNTTATFGSLVVFRKGESPTLLDLQLKVRILLVDTRVSRQTHVLAQRVRSLMERNREALDCIMDAIDHISQSALKILHNISSGPADSVDDQYQHLAELWHMNHCLLASIGVSHPALESIRASAEKFGLGAKLTGAGGGGYAIILVPHTADQKVVVDLTKELTSKGFKVTDAAIGGQGILFH